MVHRLYFHLSFECEPLGRIIKNPSTYVGIVVIYYLLTAESSYILLAETIFYEHPCPEELHHVKSSGNNQRLFVCQGVAMTLTAYEFGIRYGATERPAEAERPTYSASVGLQEPDTHFCNPGTLHDRDVDKDVLARGRVRELTKGKSGRDIDTTTEDTYTLRVCRC